MWRALVTITTESSVSRMVKEFIITLHISETVFVIYIYTYFFLKNAYVFTTTSWTHLLWNSLMWIRTYFLSTTKKIQRFLVLFTCINYSTGFRRLLRPSSGSQNCTYSVRYCQTNTTAIVDEMERSSISSTIAVVLVWQYLTLYVQFCDPDDGRRSRLKHVEQFIEINRTRKASVLLVVF